MKLLGTTAAVAALLLAGTAFGVAQTPKEPPPQTDTRAAGDGQPPSGSPAQQPGATRPAGTTGAAPPATTGTTAPGPNPSSRSAGEGQPSGQTPAR